MALGVLNNCRITENKYAVKDARKYPTISPNLIDCLMVYKSPHILRASCVVSEGAWRVKAVLEWWFRDFHKPPQAF